VLHGRPAARLEAIPLRSQIIEKKLDRIFELANSRYSQRSLPSAIEKDDLSPIEKQTFQTLSNTFAISVYIGKHNLPKG
jgi:hypothetical protein